MTVPETFEEFVERLEFLGAIMTPYDEEETYIADFPNGLAVLIGPYKSLDEEER